MISLLLLLVLTAFLLGSNAVITCAVVRSAACSPRQRTLQIGLIWLLPVFGPVLVGGVLWSDRHRRPVQRDSIDPDAGAIGGTGDPISDEP